jgi:hypothetical protein
MLFCSFERDLGTKKLTRLGHTEHWPKPYLTAAIYSVNKIYDVSLIYVIIQKFLFCLIKPVLPLTAMLRTEYQVGILRVALCTLVPVLVYTVLRCYRSE